MIDRCFNLTLLPRIKWLKWYQDRAILPRKSIAVWINWNYIKLVSNVPPSQSIRVPMLLNMLMSSFSCILLRSRSVPLHCSSALLSSCTNWTEQLWKNDASSRYTLIEIKITQSFHFFSPSLKVCNGNGNGLVVRMRDGDGNLLNTSLLGSSSGVTMKLRKWLALQVINVVFTGLYIPRQLGHQHHRAESQSPSWQHQPLCWQRQGIWRPLL